MTLFLFAPKSEGGGGAKGSPARTPPLALILNEFGLLLTYIILRRWRGPSINSLLLIIMFNFSSPSLSYPLPPAVD